MKKGNRKDHSENSQVLVSFKVSLGLERNTLQAEKGFLLLNLRKTICLTEGHTTAKYKYTTRK